MLKIGKITDNILAIKKYRKKLVSPVENGTGKEYNVWRDISMLRQLTISFLTPILLMIFLCLWLKEKTGMGDWLVLVGILWGVGSGVLSVYKYLKKRIDRAEKQRQQEYKDKYG